MPQSISPIITTGVESILEMMKVGSSFHYDSMANNLEDKLSINVAVATHVNILSRSTYMLLKLF